METKPKNNYIGMKKYHPLNFIIKKIEKKLKIKNKGNRKTNFIF
jgi:hypothetical protein